LNDATLLATLLASESRDIAFKRADNGIEPTQSSSLVEASQLENTDIFYITYHSPISSDDALRVSGILAEEIIDYTKRLQQSEAISVIAILAKEVAGLEKRIQQTNSEILDFAKSKDFIGGESQVAAVLGKLSQVELELENARTAEKSLNAQLAELKNKIRSHSPVNLRLSAAREELAELRLTYTDDNPLVQSKLEGIRYMEKQIADLDGDKEINIESFTGTPLGNQIYLDIIDVSNRLSESRNRMVALEQQRAAAAARLSEFPAIITQYDALRAKRDSSISELSLMSNRLKEAEIFASGSPGYWQIFQPPDPRNVVPSSLLKKPLILGVAGAFGGAVFVVVGSLLLTQRSNRRSVLECCAATRAPLASLLPAHAGEPSGFANLWTSILAPCFADGQNSILIWTNALEPADERSFWEELAAAAEKDAATPLRIVDLTPDNLWQSTNPGPSLRWINDDFEINARTILRASSLPDMDRRKSLSQISRWYAIVRGEKSSLRTYSLTRHQAETYLEPCSGTIVLSEPAQGQIRSFADRISVAITRHFSRLPS
ncbi:MAG: hypothetical protein ACK57I_05885, partial [Akkermansiaceae bacterium]|jgi:uncharacterized protein involved in exopolysaccharide biosynthesis